MFFIFVVFFYSYWLLYVRFFFSCEKISKKMRFSLKWKGVCNKIELYDWKYFDKYFKFIIRIVFFFVGILNNLFVVLYNFL